MASTPLEDVPAEEAQNFCNFVVLQPASVPNGCQVLSNVKVRQEEPPQPPQEGVSGTAGVPAWTSMRPCSVVVYVSSEDKCRCVRLKEYLPDFFPSGHTHGALCPPNGHYVGKADAPPGPRRSFNVGTRCGYLGVDYAGCLCATSFVCGTMVEARVSEGTFQDDELIEMIGSLKPVQVGSGLDDLMQKSFAERCYWSRHPLAVHRSFLGVSSLFEGFLWNYGLGETAPSTWRPGSAKALPGEFCAPVSLTGYSLDSVGVVGAGGSDPMEIFALYYPTSTTKDSYVWVRHVRCLGPNQLDVPWPPKLGAYPCEEPVVQQMILGSEVFSVHVDLSIGPHDALFATPQMPKGWFTLLQASPCSNMDKKRFLGVVEDALHHLAEASNHDWHNLAGA